MQAARIAAAFLSVAFCVGAEDLLQELKRRSATEGLALIQWGGFPVEVVPFNTEHLSISNTPYFSTAWFSSGNGIVAWNHHRSLTKPLSCSGAIIVESPKGAPWQLPGSINTTTLGVSADGRRVAFEGTYQTRVSLGESVGERTTGLAWADSNSNEVTSLSKSCEATSISWSPEGNSFTYDCQNHVLIYDLQAAKSRLIASGSTPTWSPDGQWIAFRAAGGRAMAIDPTTMKSKPLMDGRKIEWAIHWSPDSRYVMAAQRVGFF